LFLGWKGFDRIIGQLGPAHQADEIVNESRQLGGFPVVIFVSGVSRNILFPSLLSTK
jgi:hypothetical protein